MSELKATPGEWEVNEDGDVVVKGSNAFVGFPSQQGCIASLDDGEYIENHNIYDAHLIAAAPEIYEALRAITDHVAGYVYSEDDPYVIACRAALAKARGEQQ